MDGRRGQRQEKLQDQLTADGLSHFPGLHADLFHDLEPLPVLVAFGDLLVVDDEDGGEQAHEAQQDAEEQEGAVHLQHVMQAFPFGVEAVLQFAGSDSL